MEFLLTLGKLVGLTLLVCAGVVALVTLSGSRRHRLYRDGGMDLLDEAEPKVFAGFVAEWMAQSGVKLSPCLEVPEPAQAFEMMAEGVPTLLAVRRERAAIGLAELQALATFAKSRKLPLHLLTNTSLYPDAEKWARAQGVKITAREQLIRQLGAARTRALAERHCGRTAS